MGECANRPEPHLEVRDLRAGYRGVTVVDGASVTVGRGEIVSVVGANGSGKSTLLRAIVGEIAPMGGAVRLDGQEITGKRTDQLTRLGLGYVAQSDNVFDPLTVGENLDMGAYLVPRAERASRITRALDAFPALADKRSRVARKLSGGERRMLAIARALVTEPSLIVLDEPTANLTPQLAERLLGEYVTRLADSGMAVLLVEQRAREALRISNWAYLLGSGRVRLSTRAVDLANRADLPMVLLGAPVTASVAAGDRSVQL